MMTMMIEKGSNRILEKGEIGLHIGHLFFFMFVWFFSVFFLRILSHLQLQGRRGEEHLD